jgi:hypothetical protein
MAHAGGGVGAGVHAAAWHSRGRHGAVFAERYRTRATVVFDDGPPMRFVGLFTFETR